MTGTLKVTLVTIDGEKRVPPEVMRILLEFAEHRGICEECSTAWETKSGRYCGTGATLVIDLLSEDGVTMTPDQA